MVQKIPISTPWEVIGNSQGGWGVPNANIFKGKGRLKLNWNFYSWNSRACSKQKKNYQNVRSVEAELPSDDNCSLVMSSYYVPAPLTADIFIVQLKSTRIHNKLSQVMMVQPT